MKPRVLNIAHRGFSAQYPENTMLAFTEAINAGAHGIECDLRMTSDGQIVIFHDDRLDRLCGQSGSIEEMTMSRVKQLRVKGTESIPSLVEFLNHFHTTTLNLEIKPSTRDAIVVEAVLRELTKVRPQGRILISSFSSEVLKSLHVMDPERRLAELGILVETAHLEALPSFSRVVEAQTWNVPKQVLQSPWHQRWPKEEIKPIWTWTLDEPHEWQSALASSLPVESIISNKTEALSSFLASRFTP